VRMEDNREKASKTRIDESRAIGVKPFLEELSTRTKRDEMPSIIRKMARDRRKSIIGEIARRDRHRARSRFRQLGVARRRFMAP
jgi:hypothetical protein